MVVDVHGHVSAPERLYAYKANLLAHRGSHGRGGVVVTDDEVRAAVVDEVGAAFGVSHMEHLNTAGIDLQVISPRPYQMMHSEQPSKIVEWFTEETNNMIHRCCQLFPGRFAGMAGMPQTPWTEPATWIPEMKRGCRNSGALGSC